MMRKTINLLKANYQKIRQFVLYGLIGFSTAIVDFSLFILISSVFKVDELVSNIISTNIALLCSFILNALFNFKKTDRIVNRAACFFLIGYIGVVVSSGIIYIGVKILDYPNGYVKIFSMIIVAISQYFANSKFTFRRIT